MNRRLEAPDSTQKTRAGSIPNFAEKGNSIFLETGSQRLFNAAVGTSKIFVPSDLQETTLRSLVDQRLLDSQNRQNETEVLYLLRLDSRERDTRNFRFALTVLRFGASDL